VPGGAVEKRECSRFFATVIAFTLSVTTSYATQPSHTDQIAGKITHISVAANAITLDSITYNLPSTIGAAIMKVGQKVLVTFYVDGTTYYVVRIERSQ
jgi:hypothetical protein